MSATFYDIKIPFGNAYALPHGAVSTIIASKNADCALLLLYIVKNSGSIDHETAIEELGMTKEKFSAAISLLIAEKIIIPLSNDMGFASPESKNLRTEYSEEEIKSAISGDPDFASIYNSCSAAFARPLKKYEADVLLSIYHQTNLPAEVIHLLISYKVEENQQRIASGGSQKNITARDIASEAARWDKAGIDTLEAADEHIKQLQERSTMEGQLKRLLGIRNRRPSPTELTYIKSFMDMGFDLDVIEKAYDITVVNKGNLVWPYMNSILKRWHRDGKHKLSEIETQNSSNTPDYPPQKLSEVNYEYFERAKKHINKEEN